MIKYIILINFLLCTITVFPQKKLLIDYSFNYFSQFGEDGIIEKIFSIIDTTSKICLEVGASDGLSCSNVAYLWGLKNWKAILIESDKIKFQELNRNISNYPNCQSIFLQIGCEENNSIDSIIKNLNIKELDFISIDIDGNDFYIFKNLQIKPRVIMCEYNVTIPPLLEVYQVYDKSINFGCSVRALVNIANQKNYFLVAITHGNCIFVDNKYFNKFSEFELDINKLIIEDNLKYISTDLSGKPIIIGKNKWSPFGINTQGFNKNACFGKNLIQISTISLDKSERQAAWWDDNEIMPIIKESSNILNDNINKFKSGLPLIKFYKNF